MNIENIVASKLSKHWGFIILFFVSSLVNAQNSLKTIVLNGDLLAKNLKVITNNTDPSKKLALKNFLKSADKIVKEGNLYSVMHKKQTPPSGDRHDL